MKILWLGQGGLLFVSGKTKIMIDPYLSDSLSKHNFEFVRRMKINKKLLKVKPTALVITNSHSDHADIETIERIVKHRKNRKKLTVLSCESVFDELVDIPTVCQANHIMLEEGSEWTVDNINICAVSAKTDDKSAFGVIITDLEDNKKYYVTGDTLYSKYVLEHLPSDIYATFLPINGEYGSMNLTDAKRFAEKVNSVFFVPVHFGMFDKINPKDFNLPNAVIPSAYKIINFDSEDNQPYKSGLDYKFNEKQEKNNNNESKNETDAVIVYEEACADDAFSSDKVPVIIENEIIEDNEGESDLKSSDVISYEEASVQNIIDVSENESDISSDDESLSTDYDDFDEDEELEDYEELEEEADYTPHIIPNDDDSDKIDAYIREIEKFERGETTDFSKID